MTPRPRVIQPVTASPGSGEQQFAKRTSTSSMSAMRMAVSPLPVTLRVTRSTSPGRSESIAFGCSSTRSGRIAFTTSAPAILP